MDRPGRPGVALQAGETIFGLFLDLQRLRHTEPPSNRVIDMAYNLQCVLVTPPRNCWLAWHVALLIGDQSANETFQRLRSEYRLRVLVEANGLRLNELQKCIVGGDEMRIEFTFAANEIEHTFQFELRARPPYLIELSAKIDNESIDAELILERSQIWLGHVGFVQHMLKPDITFNQSNPESLNGIDSNLLLEFFSRILTTVSPATAPED